jgi:hypothetical protein
VQACVGRRRRGEVRIAASVCVGSERSGGDRWAM